MATATVPCNFCSALNHVDLARIAQRPKCGQCSRLLLLDRPLRLSDSQFDRIVNDAHVRVLVDFYADWCAPCKAMAPAIDEFAHEHPGQVLVGKMDTDRNPQTAARFGIRGIPTLIVFENGSEIKRQTGAMGRAALERLVDLPSSRAKVD
ncbi:MAG TPA: thioredoxin [Longimicrobiales bacterium]|nr:thioredoxin [Longimicrobiales bacterium]